MVNKRHHFVPQFYLKQFRGDSTDRVLVCLVAPFKSVGLGPIRGQCKRDHFYGKDGPIDRLLQETERHVAPVLYRVNSSTAATTADWQALRLLAVQLHLRTNKAAELAKVFPQFVAHQYVTAAIKMGKLPPPKGGWSADMMDFDGVPGTLLGLNQIGCYLETSTLSCKLLKAPPNTFFITSDNPSITLNQFAAEAKGPRDCVGFAQAGFQLVLPLSPLLCAFLYDPSVYKVGNRHDSTVRVTADDVEILNSLQVQSAECCLYAHVPQAVPEIERLVATYAKFRKPSSAGMKSYPQSEKETLIMFSDPTIVIPKRWSFCGRVKNVRRLVGDRRNPGLTHIIQLLLDDIEKNPSGAGIDDRLENLFAHIPADQPVSVIRRPQLRGVKLPPSRKDWEIVQL